MSDGNKELDAVYALQTADDNRRHYDGWAETYDSDFVADMDYRLPERVAAAFAAAQPDGPVLDVGAGTGLVGVALTELGIGPVDGTDISPGMLAAAAKKGVYARLFDDAQLVRLREIASSVQCECPNHLATIVESLVAFESYSRRCESVDAEDADLHGRLARGTGRARAVVEALLVDLMEYDDLSL